MRRAGRRCRPRRIVRRHRCCRSRRIGGRAGRTQRHRRPVRQAARRLATPIPRPTLSSDSAPNSARAPSPRGARIETEATVWGGFAPDEIAALVRGTAITFRPRRLIIAPGAHERPVPLPGWTLPGVMTTGSLQTLVRAQRVCPGERVLIAGSGPLNLQLACELLACGMKPLAVVGAAPRPGPATWRQAWTMARTSPDLMREGFGMLLTLKRAGVPVLWSARVKELHGDERVQFCARRGRAPSIATSMSMSSR